MILVFLYVDKPVASLQFDMLTAGTVTLSGSVNKQIAIGSVGGKTRVIIYGLDQTTFVGKFAQIDADISQISGVVGADAGATPIAVTVKSLSQPKHVKVEKVK